MRWLLLFALASTCFAQELLRPTVDIDGSNNLTLGCNGVNLGSVAMPLGHDAAGISTGDAIAVQGTQTQTRFVTRVFSTWPGTGNVYSALTVNVNWSATETTSGSTGRYVVNYSLDGGATYNRLAGGGGSNQAQVTNTVSISATQNLTLLKVAVCAQGTAGGDTLGSHDTIFVYDVWTVGTISSGQGGGTGSTAGQANRDTIVVN